MRHEKALLRADRKAFSMFEKSYYGDIACARSLSSCTEIYCATTYTFVTKAFFAKEKFSLKELKQFPSENKNIAGTLSFYFPFHRFEKDRVENNQNFQEAV